MTNSKRRRSHDNNGESFFVLVGGDAHQSQGGPRHKREFLHASVSFVGDAYQKLRGAGIARARIITICQLEDYRTFLYKGAHGQLGEHAKTTQEFYQKQLDETDQHCQLMLEEGGADYDFTLVNPATVWAVLGGEPSGRHHRYHKVVPKEGCSALFFAIYSHGDSHTSIENNNDDDDSLYPNDHDHTNAEWFVHFPYPSPRHDIYEFVATDKAGPKAPFYLYSTQLRLLFHQLFTDNPERPVVGLLNYCTSGGNLEFMRRPAVVRQLNVDQWPLFLMSSSDKATDSLVAGLWQSFFDRLSCALLGAASNNNDNQHSFHSIFDAAVCDYHKDNTYELLNECKARAFSYPVWILDFAFGGDPWHIDLKDFLLRMRDGKPNTIALRLLQKAYTEGRAYRVLSEAQAAVQGIPNDIQAPHPKRPGYVVVWARDRSAGNSIVAWKTIPHSRPYRCPIIAYQGENADREVDLAHEVAEAFDKAIAKPEYVCGKQSGIRNASVAETLLGTKQTM